MTTFLSLLSLALITWGFQYEHWIIDYKGQVRVINQADAIVSINENNINEAYKLFDAVIYEVDPDDFKKNSNLILELKDGTIFCEEQNGADFGVIAYNSFYGNQKVLLSSISDIEDCLNQHPVRQQIVSWLESVNDSIRNR